MTDRDRPPRPEPAPTLDALRKRYELLNKKRIEANANFETAAETLDALKREAREKYGTDDITELEKMLADMKSENERKLAEYQQHLEEIEAKLAEVEGAFGQGANNG